MKLLKSQAKSPIVMRLSFMVCKWDVNSVCISVIYLPTWSVKKKQLNVHGFSVKKNLVYLIIYKTA